MEQLHLLDNWKKTGICPACEKRAITGGRCIICGWESGERKEQDRRHLAWKEERERKIQEEIGEVVE